jgi:phage FluMu protein gp41
MKDEDYVLARRLADKALVDAQLAETKARTEEAKQMASDIRDGLETLRREIDRQTAGG